MRYSLLDEGMEQITDINDVNLTDNTLIGTPELVNSMITFKGKNNVMYCDDGVKIENSSVRFEGDNCLVYLSSNKSIYYLNAVILNAVIYNNSVCCFGKNNYINGKLNIILSEEKHFFVGEDGLFSFDCWIRTADPHLVYEVNTGKRINASQSVFLGDHVWIGQHAMLLKGTKVGSGSIIGAMSVVAGKTIGSNVSYAGNPAKLIARDVFFTRNSVHKYRKNQTKKHEHYDGTEFIYNHVHGEEVNFSQIESMFEQMKSSTKRLDYLKKLFDVTKKNRFYIMEPKKKRWF